MQYLSVLSTLYSVLSLYYSTLLPGCIQQPIDLILAHAADPDALFPGSMSGDDLDR